jgi:hypothetical protein
MEKTSKVPLRVASLRRNYVNIYAEPGIFDTLRETVGHCRNWLLLAFSLSCLFLPPVVWWQEERSDLGKSISGMYSAENPLKRRRVITRVRHSFSPSQDHHHDRTTQYNALAQMRRQRYEQEKNKHRQLYAYGNRDIMAGTLKVRRVCRSWSLPPSPALAS